MTLFVSSRNTEEFQEKLRKSVEQKQLYLGICKEFARKIYELENSLDTILVEEESNNGEAVKRRRKSVAVDIEDILCISADDIREDLQDIFEGGKIAVTVEGGVLQVGNETFVRGERIKVIMNKERFVGVISTVGDEDVVFKTKDHKRIKIPLDDIRSSRSSVTKLE